MRDGSHARSQGTLSQHAYSGHSPSPTMINRDHGSPSRGHDSSNRAIGCSTIDGDEDPLAQEIEKYGRGSAHMRSTILKVLYPEQ